MKKILPLVAAALLLTTSLARAQSATGTTSVQVTVDAEASITINTSPTTLTTAGTVFNNYTGATSFTYKIRTKKTGGNGTITVLFSDDLKSGFDTILLSNLTYGSTVGAPGSGVSAGTATSKTTGTTVATFTTDNHSADAGTGSNTVNWTLVNNPSYTTGSYSATATFTISSSL